MHRRALLSISRLSRIQMCHRILGTYSTCILTQFNIQGVIVSYISSHVPGHRRGRKQSQLKTAGDTHRHATISWGNPYFSVKICINPYPSFIHRCIAKTFRRFISRCSLQKKSRHSSSFGFFPSGVATADFPSPVVSINCIFLRHFNLSHVLFHHIHKPPFWPSPFPLSWQLHHQHPSPNIPIIFPP